MRHVASTPVRPYRLAPDRGHIDLRRANLIAQLSDECITNKLVAALDRLEGVWDRKVVRVGNVCDLQRAGLIKCDGLPSLIITACIVRKPRPRSLSKEYRASSHH
jgi:hypothetical protein